MAICATPLGFQKMTSMVELSLTGVDYVSIRKNLSFKGVEGESYMDILMMGDVQLERYITKVMLDIGVPAHLKGYHYLRDAIMLSGKDMEAVSSVTKLLYPTIAKHFKTTDQKVERAIRNAIEVSWTRGNSETFVELFGYSFEQGKNRPTNSEYIARIADKVRLDIRAM